MVFRLRKLAPIIFIAALQIARADNVNLVVNGGFETGDFTGWTESGDLSPCLFVGTVGGAGTDGSCYPATTIAPHGGNFTAYLGNNDADAYLTQRIATGLTGGTYTLTFWLASQSGVPPTDFSVYWGGKRLIYQSNLAQFDWTKYTFSGLHAAEPTTTLQFAFRDDATYLALDDISVVDPLPAAVPEPGFLIPIIGLFACLGVRFYHLKRRPVSAQE